MGPVTYSYRPQLSSKDIPLVMCTDLVCSETRLASRDSGRCAVVLNHGVKQTGKFWKYGMTGCQCQVSKWWSFCRIDSESYVGSFGHGFLWIDRLTTASFWGSALWTLGRVKPSVHVACACERKRTSLSSRCHALDKDPICNIFQGRDCQTTPCHPCHL